MTADLTRNTMTGAEAMVRMLEAHGVRHIFGLCGDTSLPFYDALHQLDHCRWYAQVGQKPSERRRRADHHQHHRRC